jgi:hypothetical protein
MLSRMTLPDAHVAGPSRVLGPQRVRRRLGRLMAAEKRHAERMHRDLRKLEILVSRCLRLRDLPRPQLAWCQEVYDLVAVCLVTSNTIENHGPTFRWAYTCADRLDRMLATAKEALPDDRDPRPARRAHKRA